MASLAVRVAVQGVDLLDQQDFLVWFERQEFLGVFQNPDAALAGLCGDLNHLRVADAFTGLASSAERAVLEQAVIVFHRQRAADRVVQPFFFQASLLHRLDQPSQMVCHSSYQNATGKLPSQPSGSAPTIYSGFPTRQPGCQ